MVTELRARVGNLVIRIALAFVAALTCTLTTLAAQSSPSITVTPAAIGPDETVTVTIANGPGSPTDWVALYPAGAPNPAYLDWKYLNGSRTAPSTGVTSATLTFTLPTTPGAYVLRFYANNDFDLLGSASATVVADDTTPPVISGVAASSITSAGATITWTTDEASDSQVEYGLTTAYGSASALDGSLVTAHTMSVSGLTGSALYHVRVMSRDAAGNLTLSSDVTVTTLDGTAPTVALTAPATATTVSGVTTVSATASDNLGVAGVQFQLDGAPLGAEDVTAPYSVSWTTATATNGPHTLTAVARDADSNQTTSAARSITVDKTQPVISAVAVSSITATGATFTWTTNEPSDTQVNYGLTAAYGTNTPLVAADVTSHSVVRTGLTPNTTYHYRVRSRDAAVPGNLALSGDFTFTTLADVTSPAVAISAPAANATVSGAMTVTATASDGVGVAGVQFQLDGAPLGAEDVAAPFSVLWDTTTVPDGLHTLTAVARDAATNQTTSAARTVTVANDSAPPVVSAVAASAITATGATISWTTTEASDSQVEYGVTTAYGSTSALNGNLVTSHTVAVGSLTSATLYHYRVRSRDAAGNLATSGDATFTTLDATAPTVSISAPSAGATVGGTVTVTANAGDTMGVAGVQFRVDGAPLGAEDVTAPYEVSWNTTGSVALVFGVTKVIVLPMAMTAGSGFTKRLSLSCPACPGEDMVSQDRIQTAAGPTAATWTFSSPAHYLAQMAAFKATGTPAYVQGAVATSNSPSTMIAQTLDANVGTGNLLVVAVAWQGTSAVSVTDSRGNGYAVATQAYDAVNGQSLAILYAANTVGGATTVTASFGASPTAQRLEIHEYSGIATTNPLDVTATNIADGTTTANAVTSGSATPSGIAPVANGSHTLTAQARDAAGNTTMSAAVTVTVNNGGDTTPPVISGVTVSAITASGATFTWTTNEGSDSQVDYGPTTAYGSTSTLNANLVTAHTVALGSLTPTTLYHFRVRSRDAAGNLATSADVTFSTLDATPPVISAVAASAITATGATISWTTTEASDSQVEYGVTTAYGSTSALNGNLVTSHTVAVGSLTSATLYHYRVRSRDAAGNLATSGDATFTTLDATAPTVSISAPSAGATVGGTVTVTANAGDTMGVAGVQFRVDGAPLGAEDVTAPYEVSWNTTGSVALVFGVTKVIVLPMAMTAGSGFTKRLSLSCPACPGEDMVSQDKIQTAAGSTAATWTFSSPAHYLAQMAAFKATGTPAYVQGAVATSNSPSTMIAQTLDANVGTGNLLVVAVAWQGTSAVSVTDSRGNGYAVATQAYDAVNGQSLAILYAANTVGGATTVTASFGASPTAQRLEIHEYSGIATTNPLDVTATNIADGTTTANAVTSGSATPSGIAPVANGSHTLTAQARDAAGNTTMSAAVTVTVNNGGDTTPPVISGVTVSAITASGATFSWTTNEASDTEVEYGPTTAYGGFSTLNVTRVTAHTMSLSGLAAGTLHHYRVRSRDAAGNLGLSGDLTFTTLEGTPPTVAITAPAQGAMVSGTVTVTANASDNVGVVGVQFRVDGVALGAEDTVAPYAVSWNTSTASPGSPVLTAVARDAAGNQRTSSPVTVTVATADVTLAWNPNSESDLDGYKLHFGTAAGSYSVHVDVGNVTSYTVSGLQPGTAYYFAVTAYDLGGAESGASNEVSATR